MTVVKKKIDFLKGFRKLLGRLGILYSQSGCCSAPRSDIQLAPEAVYGCWSGAKESVLMSLRTMVVHGLVFSAFCSPSMLGQQKSEVASPVLREFPIALGQTLVAGKTPVGTKVEGKLAVATLVAGKVMPRDATFSGEVTESSPRTKTDPSRLAVRLDSEQWKDGSASIKVYLTPWFYPAKLEAGQELQYGPQQPASKTWNGQGQYPSENSAVYRPFPGRDSGQSSPVPDTPNAVTSNQRLRIKDVEPAQSIDGGIALISKRSNIKLERLTTYVMIGEEPLPAK